MACGGCRCGHGPRAHAPEVCPLRIEGILRPGDIIQAFLGLDHEQLTGWPRSPSGRIDASHPWPCLCFPAEVDGGDPFAHHVPADFAERAAREGRILPVDPWSTWTEEIPAAILDARTRNA